MKFHHGYYIGIALMLFGRDVASSELLIFYGEVAFWSSVIMGFMPKPVVNFLFSGERDAA